MRVTATAVAALALVPLLAVTPAAAEDPSLENIYLSVQLAEATTELITNLDAIGWPAESANNRYTGASEATTIVFGTPGSPTTYRSETRCATFVRRLMTHRFPWADTSYFTTEFGSSFPNSARFYDALEADRAQTDNIPKVRAYQLRVFPYFNLRAGDIMAIKYVDAPASDSGHMAIIGTGSHLVDDTHPDYREWAVRVMDSTSSAHGNPANPRGFPDTRFFFNQQTQAWDEAQGAGMGWMFIRTSRTHWGIISHSWSRNAADWHDMTDRPILIGRLDPYA